MPDTPEILLPRTSPRCPLFLTPEWFELLDRFGMPASLQRANAVTHDGLRLPLLQEPGVLRSLSSYYSPEFGIVGGPTPDNAQANELVHALRKFGRGRIDLRPLHAGAGLLASMLPALCRAGYFCDTLQISTNWYLPSAGLSWSTYLDSRPGRLRNTLRRCRKRLESEAGFRIAIIDGQNTELAPALADYAQVYAASWKEAEPFPEFMPQLCGLAASHGWLRLGLLYVGGEPAAAQVWFVKDETASIYKLAYDARFARMGVGTVLTAALCEHVLDADRVAEIDFLTGDDAYKSEWMSHSRPLLALLAFDGRSASGLLHAARHFGGRKVRGLVRK